MHSPELREQCARQLLAAEARVGAFNVFVGLDGFVDEIIHVVDKRDNAESFHRLPTIVSLADRLAAAAGQSTNVELVRQNIKLGGNGPIMANTLANFGLKVTCLGTLGYPNLHPVFAAFARRAEVHSLAEPGYTDALEFTDGKIMFGKHTSLKEVNWQNVQTRFGIDKLKAKLNRADLVAFMNWTMLPHMSEVWTALLQEVCPTLNGKRRKIFFDLADPEKRTLADIERALELIVSFEKYFDVLLGLNEKEACEISHVLGIPTKNRSPQGLVAMALEIHRRLPVNTLVVHPVSFAITVSEGVVNLIEGPYFADPFITTGAGDHFNSGFCLGKLLGFENSLSLLTGVATSGHYVRTGQSPGIADVASLLRRWPAD
jgi:ketohexokinase